ncbi:LAMI_0H17040g1_1 [Lachancea mirantina]|uniref:LAMI_0H17040g1_1 n=1 Tax=Lachancea mirantina TaxID=1230905 RepID=A0A1G4KJ88_9SACH|nr:LAMI_0H17040g1_1 [Lachancea mirantina]
MSSNYPGDASPSSNSGILSQLEDIQQRINDETEMALTSGRKTRKRQSFTDLLSKRDKRKSMPPSMGSSSHSGIVGSNSAKEMNFVIGLSENLLVECRKLQAENEKKKLELRAVIEESHRLEERYTQLNTIHQHLNSENEKVRQINEKIDNELQASKQSYQKLEESFRGTQAAFEIASLKAKDLEAQIHELSSSKARLQEKIAEEKGNHDSQLQLTRAELNILKVEKEDYDDFMQQSAAEITNPDSNRKDHLQNRDPQNQSTERETITQEPQEPSFKYRALATAGAPTANEVVHCLVEQLKEYQGIIETSDHEFFLSLRNQKPFQELMNLFMSIIKKELQDNESSPEKLKDNNSHNSLLEEFSEALKSEGYLFWCEKGINSKAEPSESHFDVHDKKKVQHIPHSSSNPLNDPQSERSSVDSDELKYLMIPKEDLRYNHGTELNKLKEAFSAYEKRLLTEDEYSDLINPSRKKIEEMAYSFNCTIISTEKLDALEHPSLEELEKKIRGHEREIIPVNTFAELRKKSDQVNNFMQLYFPNEDWSDTDGNLLESVFKRACDPTLNELKAALESLSPEKFDEVLVWMIDHLGSSTKAFWETGFLELSTDFLSQLDVIYSNFEVSRLQAFMVSRSFLAELLISLKTPKLIFLEEKCRQLKKLVIDESYFREMEEHFKRPPVNHLKNMADAEGLALIEKADLDNLNELLASPSESYLKEKARDAGMVIFERSRYEDLLQEKDKPNLEVVTTRAADFDLVVISRLQLQEMKAAFDEPLLEYLEAKATQAHKLIVDEQEYRNLLAELENPSMEYLVEKAQLHGKHLTSEDEYSTLQNVDKSLSEQSITDVTRTLSSHSRQPNFDGLHTCSAPGSANLTEPTRDDHIQSPSSSNKDTGPNPTVFASSIDGATSKHFPRGLRKPVVDAADAADADKTSKPKEGISQTGLKSSQPSFPPNFDKNEQGDSCNEQAELTMTDIYRAAENLNLAVMSLREYEELSAATISDGRNKENEGTTLARNPTICSFSASEASSSLTQGSFITANDGNFSSSEVNGGLPSNFIFGDSESHHSLTHSGHTVAIEPRKSNDSTSVTSTIREKSSLSLDSIKNLAGDLGYELVPIEDARLRVLRSRSAASHSSLQEGQEKSNSLGKSSALDEKPQNDTEENSSRDNSNTGKVREVESVDSVIEGDHPGSPTESLEYSVDPEYTEASNVKHSHETSDSNLSAMLAASNKPFQSKFEPIKPTKKEEGKDPEGAFDGEVVDLRFSPTLGQASIAFEIPLKSKSLNDIETLKSHELINLDVRKLGDVRSGMVKTSHGFSFDELIIKATELDLVPIHKEQFEQIKKELSNPTLTKRQIQEYAKNFHLVTLENDQYERLTGRLGEQANPDATDGFTHQETPQPHLNQSQNADSPLKLTGSEIQKAAKNFGFICIPSSAFIPTSSLSFPDPSQVVLLPASYYESLSLRAKQTWEEVTDEELQAEVRHRGLQLVQRQEGTPWFPLAQDRITRQNTVHSTRSNESTARRSLAEAAASAAYSEYEHQHLKDVGFSRSSSMSRQPNRVPEREVRTPSKKSFDATASLATFASLNEPSIIPALTQTVIGEYLFKYFRRLGPLLKAEGRHERYFWIHPYTLTLYWSTSNPVLENPSSTRAKAVAILGVESVEDLNPYPTGLYNRTIVITTETKPLRITCPTKQRHNIWFNSLRYLLKRSKESHGMDNNNNSQLSNFPGESFKQAHRRLSFTRRPMPSFRIKNRSRSTRSLRTSQ